MNTEIKPKQTALESLSAGVKVVRTLVKTANTSPDLLLNRSATMKSLSKAINRLDKVVSDKSVRALLPVRKQAKKLHNTLVSLNHGLAEDTLEVDDFLSEITTTCADSVEALELICSSLDYVDNSSAGVDLDGTLLGDMSSESSKEIELSDLPDTLKMPVKESQYRKTVESLNRYEKAKSRLATSIKKSAVVPVQLPLVVMFESAKLRNPDILETIFPTKVDLIGVNGERSADIGHVLRDQVVLQFSKTAAFEMAQENIIESGTAAQLQTAKGVVKNLKAKLKPLVAEFNEASQDLEELMKPPKSVPKGGLALLADLRKEREREIAVMQARVDELKLRAAQVREKLSHYEGRVRDASSVHNANKKSKLVNENVYFDHITDFLNSLREHGKNYTLLSSTFLQSPVNSDIMTCWVVESAAYRKMVGLAGNPKVFSWGPAWSTGKAQRRKSMPASMKLSTKIR